MLDNQKTGNRFLTNNSENRGPSPRNYNSQIKRHHVLNLYKIFAVTVIAALILIGLRIHWKNLVYTDYEVKSEHKWTKSSQMRCMNLAGSIFAYSYDGMFCMDTKGKVIWNQTYEMQEPIVRTCDKVVAVGEYNGRDIYISNTEEILGKITTTMPIRDFCVASNGVVAAVLDDSTVTSIFLYSVSGDPLVQFKTTMSKSGYPLAIDITKDGKQVAISYLKAESGAIKSDVAFYNFSAVGQNYTDNLVGAYGYTDAVIPVISFMNNDAAFALGDHKLMFYEGKQKPVNKADIWIADEIQSVFYDDNYVGLVFYDTSGENTYLLKVYDVSGNLIQEYSFDLEYTDIIFDETGIVIYNETQCQIYNWDKLLKYEGLFTNRINCILQTGNIEKYFIVTDDAIQSIQLK